MFDHLQFYLVGGTVCTALVSAIYIPVMRRASLAQKMTATALLFAILAVIATLNWGYEPSYNSNVLGAMAPALFGIFSVGWIGCTVIDLIRTFVMSRSEPK